ncbi:MAG: 1-acyl-sn-glycerol-3-phosphate acyltransferase [Bacteroidetes bacterium]|nr:1-acyl-sn-glycerol-3-phosphate acyltransferase [Bacteroidota bacterium]
MILIFFPCVLICFPLGRIRGGNIMYDLFRFFGNGWFKLIGINQSFIYESTPDPNQQYIFIANHIAYVDAVITVLSVKHHFRPIGKAELLKIPIFGFIYKFCVVTVDRSSAEDRARSLDDLRKVLARGISIVVFPEGTFNMADAPLKEMYDGAFKLAVETGKPLQPIIFLDAFDRMHYRHFFTLTPGKSRSVYLDPIDPAQYPDADYKALNKIVEAKLSEKLLQYKATWIDQKYYQS